LGAFYATIVLSHGLFWSGRLTTQDGNPIWVARTALIILAIAIWDRHSWLPLRVISGLLAAWVAISTESRGPLIAFVTAPLLVFAVAFAKNKNRKYPRASIAIALTAVAACLSIIVILPYGSDVGSHNRLVAMLNMSQMEADANVQGRLELQHSAMNRFTASPLLGGGIGSNAPKGERSYPHNVPLEIASELGVVGLCLWFIALAYGLRSARGRRDLQVLMLQVFLYSLTSGDLMANSLIVVTFTFAYAFRGTDATTLAAGETSILPDPSIWALGDVDNYTRVRVDREPTAQSVTPNPR
jgi:O-antigen ligase